MHIKKYLIPALCALGLSLPAEAQRNAKATAEDYINQYQFDQAEELLNQDIKRLKRRRQPTTAEEEQLQKVEKMRSMMRATERLTVIDSLVTDKKTFLSHIKLSEESGTLHTYADFFHHHPQAWAAGGPILPVYETAEPAWFSHYTRALITGYLYEGDTPHPFRHGKYPGGGNAAYRREVFDRTGPFNPALGRKGNSLAGAEEKEIFDKMAQAGMAFHYLPTAILYHIIPAAKLTQEYFNRLTCSIGRSERQRTLGVSPGKYARRLAAEAVKWAATLVLLCGFCLRLQPGKGWMLVRFRRNVTKGLIGRE